MSSSPISEIGAQTSTSRAGNWNDGGMTPATV